jgi:flagellar hook-basal body complex protein FliE
MSTIQGIGPVPPPLVPELEPGGAAPSGSPAGSFADSLRQALAPVSHAQAEAAARVQDLVAGRAENLHDVQVALQKADLSFQLLLQVRNKLVQAYHEILQMQI